MAAKHYDAGLTIMDSAGNVLAGRNCLIYSDRAATSQVTTVTLYDGTTVSGGIIPSASDGRVKFAESTGAYNWLYVKAPDGQVYFVAAEEAVLGITAGGNVNDNTSETITGAWSFSTNPTFNDNAIPEAKVSGLLSDLAAAGNPPYGGTVANQAAMLALTGLKVGSAAYRSDTGSLWFLLGGSDASTLGNWVQGGGGSSFTPTIAADYAGAVVFQSSAHDAARITARSDVMVLWWTTDSLPPDNMTAGLDVWLNRIADEHTSFWNSGTSQYEPTRDAAAPHWTYVQPIAGGAEPDDTNGGAGRQDMDELIVKPT